MIVGSIRAVLVFSFLCPSSVFGGLLIQFVFQPRVSIQSVFLLRERESFRSTDRPIDLPKEMCGPWDRFSFRNTVQIC